MTTPFWLNNPNILFKSGELRKVWPSNDMSFEGKLNAMTRLVIVLTLVGYLITKNNKIIFSGLITLGAIILLFVVKTKKGNNGKFFKSVADKNGIYKWVAVKKQ